MIVHVILDILLEQIQVLIRCRFMALNLLGFEIVCVSIQSLISGTLSECLMNGKLIEYAWYRSCAL